VAKPKLQTTFTPVTPIVTAKDDKAEAAVKVINAGGTTADCWVRVLFDELPEPEFQKIAAVKTKEAGTMEFPAPKGWTKGKKRVRVEITLTDPSVTDAEGKPLGVTEFSSQEFTVEPTLT